MKTHLELYFLQTHKMIIFITYLCIIVQWALTIAKILKIYISQYKKEKNWTVQKIALKNNLIF